MIEGELLRRARQGDNAAIATLYQQHAPRVYTLLRRLAGNDAEAEDWAQEAWVRAIRGLGTFRGESGFGTWLHRIAANCPLSGRRRWHRKESHETPLPEDVISGAPRSRALLAIRLERALTQVPEGMRRVLVLHDVEGYTHEEIGEMLGIAPGTCKSQLFKARARMRELLGSRASAMEGEETCVI
jgi:RNA polymerase sigma-70 factor (ECF subfamily)